MMNTNYQKNYASFLDLYDENTTPLKVGLFVTQLAQEFASLNLELVTAERTLAYVARENEMKIDESGKPLSSAKAKVLTEGTEEAHAVTELKAHKENLRVIFAALDSLQRGMSDGLTAKS